LNEKGKKMLKAEKFQMVNYCHAMRNHGWSVEVIASRIGCSVEDVNLMLESSPVGSSIHG
jgi:hypothetical protein